MKNIKKTLLFATLLGAFNTGAMARTVSIPAASGSGSWLSGAMAAGKAALPALGAVGAAAASTLIPFGLGPIATVAAPYIIAAGANYVTKKVSGVDIAAVKYQEELKDEVGRLSNMMRRRDRRYKLIMRKMRRLRSLRRRRESRYMDEDDDIEDYDDDIEVNFDDEKEEEL